MTGSKVDLDTGSSYIHTAQARTLLMQKLMQGRDGDGSKNLQDDDGSAIRSQNFANPKLAPVAGV